MSPSVSVSTGGIGKYSPMALREAGRAIMLLSEGLRLESIGIGPDSEFARKPEADDAPEAEVHLDWLLREARIRLAGTIAQTLYGAGAPTITNDDLAHSSLLADLIERTAGEEPGTWLLQTIPAVVRATLTTHAPGVLALAKALDAQRALSGEQARSIVMTATSPAGSRSQRLSKPLE